MTETLDNQNAEVLPAVDESAVVQAALQNQLIARGDHLMPGEHGGFSIERLSDDHLRQPVTYGFAFGWGDGALAEQFAESYMEGTTPVVRVEDAQTEKRLPGIVVTFPVSESKYREAVSQGKVADGLFDADGKAAGVQPGTEALDALVGKESMRQSLKKAYSDVTGKAYLHEMAEIDYSAAKLLPNISEAFDFMDTDEQRQMRPISRIDDFFVRQRPEIQSFGATMAPICRAASLALNPASVRASTPSICSRSCAMSWVSFAATSICESVGAKSA